VAGLNRNGWQLYAGTGGRFSPELLAGLSRNTHLIEDINNNIYLSTISIWEIIIKAKLGKLKIIEPIYHYIQKSRDLHLINSLEFEEKNLHILESLPDIHKDPFDRLLICQAISNNIIFITNDSEIIKYPVKTI